jgi:hypothetical protein
MFYKKLNLPPIPTELLDNVVGNLHNNIVVNDIGYGKEYIKNNKILTACRYTYGLVRYEELDNWLKINIPGLPTYFNVLYQTQISRNNSPSTHIIHTDKERVSALNFLIDDGGPDVVTSWYKENGKELFRQAKPGGIQTDSGAVSYQNVELLKSAKLEKNHWYIIDTRILHDVDNITTTRKSISISFSHRKFLE